MSDNKQQTSQKKRSYASNATITLLATIGIIVGINVLSGRLFGRWDLTKSKVYTLSDSSKELVRNLPDYVTLKAYISSDLPPELASTSRYVRDLLDEYQASAKGGKLRFQAADPSKDKKIEDEATSCGVRPMQVQKLESSKVEVGSYFMGICVSYNGKQEAIPQAVNQEGIEYQVTSVIKRMTQRKRKIAFTSGHGELELQGIQQALGQEFETTTVNPSQSAIADDVDALVVAGPKQAFDDKGRHEIDGFLMKGKGAVFLVDGMAMSQPPGHMMPGMNMPKMGMANKHGLEELLQAYGFAVDEDFVLDKRNVPGPIEVQGQRFLANAPMFTAVQLPSFDDKAFTVLEGLKGAVFPYASSVQLVGPLADGKPSQGKLWKLAESSPKSWKVSGMFMFDPQKEIKEGEAKDKGPFALGYAYQGKVKSAYAPANSNMSAPDANAPTSESKKDDRLVVLGDSDFASD